ncbi:MAG: DUF799 family lipoprotein [Elusimicrobia bacterium]|nr:DUF799 family lipoprotein [Elusimicrobiota bacterium]
MTTPYIKIFLTLTFFSGCAYNVTVKHYSTPTKLSPDQIYRPSRTFLIMQVPPLDDPEQSAFGKALDLIGAFLPKKTKQRYDQALSRANLDQIAEQTAKTFHDSGNKIVSFQIAYSSQPPSWISQFTPTASLWINPSDFVVKQEEYEVTTKTEQGEKKEKRYKIKVDYGVFWSFYAEPEHKLLSEGSFAGYAPIVEEEKVAQINDLEEYLNPQFWTLATKFLNPLKEEILPHEVTKYRQISKGKEKLELAYKKIQNNQWQEAQSLWQELLKTDPKNWEAHYNLGVSYERVAEWNQAKKEYLLAEELVPNPKTKKKIEKILMELSRLVSPAQKIEKSEKYNFYKQKIAVLPFANESIDLTGHEYLRLKIADSLSHAGYSLIPIPTIDAKLKEKGIEEGGQLNLLSPKAIAKHLGSDRLLYGTLEEFKVINVGIYYKRQVRLAVQLLDKDGKTLWQTTAQTINQSGIKPEAVAESFLINLATTQLEKIVKTYLKAESDETAYRALETLPKPVGQTFK